MKPFKPFEGGRPHAYMTEELKIGKHLAIMCPAHTFLVRILPWEDEEKAQSAPVILVPTTKDGKRDWRRLDYMGADKAAFPVLLVMPMLLASLRGPGQAGLERLRDLLNRIPLRQLLTGL